MRGVDGACAQASEEGGISTAEPVEGGDVLSLGHNLVGKRVGLCAERVMRGEQETAAFIRGIGSDQQATADEGELGIVGVVGTQGVCVLRADGAGKQDSAVGTFGQLRERDEEVVRMLVRGAGTTAALDGAEGIDDDEDSVVVFDGGFQVAEVVGEAERILAGRHSAGGPDGDGVEE